MGTGGACLLPQLVVVGGGKRLTLTQRRRTSKTHSIAALDDESLAQLNDYFGRLCTDDTYVNASPIAIGSNINIPEITEHEFWNVLSKIKRAAIVQISFHSGFARNTVKILTPIITRTWNPFISTQWWSRSWKKANINPLPKVEIPQENGEYGGVNAPLVMTRAFEKVVYGSHAKN